MLSKFVSFFVIVASVATSAYSLDLDFNSSDLYDEEGRLLVIPVGGTTTTTGLSLNITTLAALASVLASGLVTLLGLGALGFLLYSLFAGGFGGSGYGSGSGGYGGNGGYSSYSSYRR